MIRYDAPGRTCSGRPQSGTSALLAELLRRFSGSRSAGIYNCRNVAGSASLSLHAEGRALDIRPRDRAQGDQIAAWALAHAAEWGIQEIIWYRRIWSARHPSSGWRTYSGVNSHIDHVHIGQNWNGAGAPSRAVPPQADGQADGNFWGWLVLAGVVGSGLYYLYKN